MKTLFLSLVVLMALPLSGKATRSMDLSWIVVSDLDQAIEFYTDVVGLKMETIHRGLGWAEMVGTGGARMGLMQKLPDPEPGSNAIVTIRVENVVLAAKRLERQGANMIGDPFDVPGICRLQLFLDRDGNQLQLFQPLS